MMRRLLASLAGAFLLLGSGASAAADVVVSTRVCGPIAQGAAVRITPADDTDVYASAEKPLAKALAEAGHPLAEQGPAELYYTIARSLVRIRRGEGTLGRFEVRTIDRRPDALLLLNVWSSDKDSVLGGRKAKSRERTATYLVMAIELNHRQNGNCIWRGEGAVDIAGREPKFLAPRLARAVMTFMGRAVDKKTVPLPP